MADSNMAEELEDELAEIRNGTSVECPECAAFVRGQTVEEAEGKLGKHRYVAHGVDRRSGSDNPLYPAPPPKREQKPPSGSSTPSKTDDKSTDQDQGEHEDQDRDRGERKSRHWWFGDRHQGR